ncbi:Gx transporter family protein [Paludicola sp. MB14-C6]|uniref:Gx transporter family protein n=1 Tax=Paludihabitans sp. MB14-C6 TaxID=3070656 RepID=UPI0027DE0655|nr:Gx transporter family protein [Paludicola sp. MB14-C6]WMJ23304.1 Gx transporter family protein [Paludicola sp. MB14-C6]
MDKNKTRERNILQLTQLALLFALTVVLMVVESLIPPIPMLPPGVKIGLSNIVTMYVLFYLGKKYAFVILGLKGLFVFITRGATAFILSFSGGLLSIIVMIVILMLKKINISYIIISMCAAIAHNLAQLCVASILLKTTTVFYYSPILIVSGVVMGIITGIVLKATLPAMRRIKVFTK